MSKEFDVKVKSTKLENNQWLFQLMLEKTFTDEEFHPEFKKIEQTETITSAEQKAQFIQMVVSFLNKNI